MPMPNNDYILRGDAKNAITYQWWTEIDRVPAADVEPKRKWIPVTERLPENGKYVLAYSADYDYTTVEARHKFEVFQITHWMPLPEPPKEEKEN